MSLPDACAPLFAHLERLGIATTTTTHPPVRTVGEARATYTLLPGVHCKNLFLKDAKGAVVLVVCPHDRVLDVNRLHRRLGPAVGAKRLSFGKADLLMEVLGVEPGSVTPLALINDRDRRVTVVLDAEMMAAEVANYHPLVNTATTAIRTADLRRFLDSLGHVVHVVDLAAPPG
ncbi:prolyl-tRNA synthetase associated domain-containing protein [Roseospira visakhapatnamensis]|uniref:Ala-tRNA(Pro) deacylase n=1 Tax=Roseospira visakhapatnamensis TaxID=390880 RepID=A0A7W6RDA7_9PROT|nr:prolyl-tRNA synthetase associated domain-containing protein [Roseospira visakhapatnamensis]MBB4266471.1 Ala-tRNA(Pro) deacylase [Roseospira visakhapatnamensis]